MSSALLLALSACSSAPTEAPAEAPHAEAHPAAAAATAKTVDAAGLKAAMDAQQVPLVVDVRTPGEFGGGHVPGARNIPVAELVQRLPELETFKGGEIYVICEAGSRSAAASRILAARGFTPVDVTDGTAAWRAGGFPVE
jgi:rhodanese-related sulfurtransferase